MCPPECRNATANAIAYVDVSGRAHRPSPTVNTPTVNTLPVNTPTVNTPTVNTLPTDNHFFCI